MNLRLAWYLALSSLRHHRNVGLATVLGVGLGILVIATILIVDANSTTQPVVSNVVDLSPTNDSFEIPAQRVARIYFERMIRMGDPSSSLMPTQVGAVQHLDAKATPPTRRGEEDYQAMRLAVRLASLLAFGVGAIIVFYTMSFSVAMRTREMALLLCIGERRYNLVLSLLLEALLMGVAGTLLGLLLAVPAALSLLTAGISTTGRTPDPEFSLPILELTLMAMLGLLIALCGVLKPAHRLYKMDIQNVLQPRFLTLRAELQGHPLEGFAWLLAPLAAALWIAVRPFVQSWLSVVQFFLFETVIVLVLAIAVLWLTPPLLHGVIRAVEWPLRSWSPLDAVLVSRRMRLTSQKQVFTIVAVTLVFSLVTALHDITRAHKHEIHLWASEALYPYVYFKRSRPLPAIHEADYLKRLAQRNIQVFRLSDKASGELSARLIAQRDINPARISAGKRSLSIGDFILSRTLAARFDVSPGDRLVIDTGKERHRFELVEISDEIGFYAEDGQYVDLKSYALFVDGHPLFEDNLALSLGKYAMARKSNSSYFSKADIYALQPYYHYERRGAIQGHWQKAEIDRDFLIFDFVLAATVMLAAIGVANNILIQVHARERELAVLRTLGLSRVQRVRMLLTEGAVIGVVSASIALVLGNLLGAVSISFLDRFTLFDYRLVFSVKASLAISLLTVVACTTAAFYPALVANRISSAESLHYE